jgi:hypothetical protein
LKSVLKKEISQAPRPKGSVKGLLEKSSKDQKIRINLQMQP